MSTFGCQSRDWYHPAGRSGAYPGVGGADGLGADGLANRYHIEDNREKGTRSGPATVSVSGRTSDATTAPAVTL